MSGSPETRSEGASVKSALHKQVIERCHHHLLSMPGVTEDRPFGPEVPVFKVMGKMIAYLSPDRDPPWLTLKLDPAMGQLARSTYASVHAGYHMNKDHWNTILLDGTVPDTEITAWIEESYELVVSGLTKAKRCRLQQEIEGASKT